MSYDFFLLLLIQASPFQEKLLKSESILEPIQHHLTLLIHSLSSIYAEQVQHFTFLENQVKSLDLDTVEQEQIIEQEKAIENLRKSFINIQFLCSKALAIAWNSNRADLIEKLSSIKEQSQKFSTLVIGHQGHPDSPPTGLYDVLKNQLNKVFNDDNNQPLSDDEPAIEALVKFSIWYITDYWEMHLLPGISHSELDLDIDASTEHERIDYRRKLFLEVQKNLEKLGLFTLGDLKKNMIYSKVALKNYIQKNLMPATNQFDI